MKKKLIILFMTALALLLCFTACADDKLPTVESITLNTDGIKTEYEVGETPDFTALKVTVKMSDGTTKEIGYADLTVGTVDTSTAGEKKVTVKYGGLSTEFTVTVKEKPVTLTGIKIVAGSVETSVFKGALLDTTSLQVEATYSDGTKKSVPIADVEISTVDTSTAGEKTLTVTYQGMTDSVTVTVHDVTSMQVVTGTLANKLYVGEALDTTAVQLIVTYANGKTEIAEAKDITVSALDTSSYGKKTVTISYKGATLNYEVEVVGAVSLSVNQGSVATKVKVFGTLDTSEIAGIVTYSDNSKKALTASDLTVSNIATNEVGTKTLTVSYGSVSTTVSIEVVGVQSISVITDTVKSEILKGTALDTSGIRVNIVYTDNTTDVLGKDALTLVAPDHTTADDKTLSITYLDKTVTFPVKVCEITSISIKGVNTVVQAGHPIDISNMKVYGVYNDSVMTQIELTDGTITTNIADIDINSEEAKSLVVSYSGAYGSFTATVTISTTAPSFDRLEVTSYPTTIGRGGVYDKSKVLVKAYFGNNTSEQVTATVSDINTDTVGQKTMTVSYTDPDTNTTKEETLTVTVLDITSLTISGLPTNNRGQVVVTKDGTLDTTHIKVLATFSDGSTREIAASDISIGEIDTSTVVTTGSTFTVMYYDTTATVTYYVRAVESIKYLSGLADYVRFGYNVDYSNLVIEITYSNGDVETANINDIGANVEHTSTKVFHTRDTEDTDEDDDTTEIVKLATTTLTVTYEGKTFTKDITVREVTVITGLNGTIPATVFVGDTLNTDSFRITVYYDNGDTYLIDLNDPFLEMVGIDTVEAGQKAIVFKYMLLDEENGIYLQETNVQVTVNGIAKIELVEGTINKTVTVGQTLNTADLQLKVTYSIGKDANGNPIEGAFVYVNTTDINLNVGSIDTTTDGTKQLSVTYRGTTITIDIKVVDVTNVTDNTLIFGALLPDHIVARDTYKKNFKISDNPYVVGDDNPYYFYLNVLVLDKNDDIVETDGKSVATEAIVSLLGEDGTPTQLTGDELAKYVSIANNAYQFTSDAVGKTFQLKVRPKDTQLDYQVHTVTIVDGYNVHEAWELNVMTNYNNNLDDNDTTTDDNQIPLVREFLAEKMGTTWANDNEYLAFTNSIKSLVIHGNLDVTVKDIPAGYIYSYTKEGVAKTGLWEQMGIFDRRLTASNQTFAIYGNYYSIYSYNLPCVVEKGIANNDDEFSSSSLIKLLIQDEVFKAYPNGDLPFSNYSSNIQDLAMRDNDPNSNDQSASERHMRGLSALKLGDHNAHVTNVNIDAFMVSLVAEDDYTNLFLDNVKFYNAWQGHLFLWSNNYYQKEATGNKDAEPYTNNTGIQVKITNSLLAKCGGPVILAQNTNRAYNINKLSRIDVVVDEASDLHSYVTGQEAWFVAVGQTTTAGQILAMNQLVQKSTSGAGSYTTDTKIQGVNTVNMIMINMGIGTTFGAAGENYSGSYKVVDAEGKTVTTGLDMTDPASGVTPTNQALYTYLNVTAAQNNGTAAPIFQTSAGGTAYTDGATGCYGIETGEPAAPLAPFSQGEYITLYYQGMGIMMEYYH